MKLSELIRILEEVKSEYGDKHIWTVDGLDDFPMPRTIEIDLCKNIKKTEFGCSSGKSNENEEIEILIEYKGAKYFDRCIRKRY